MPLGSTFNISIQVDNRGDDSPAEYNNITFTFPQFDSSADKSRVGVSSIDADLNYNEYFGSEAGGGDQYAEYIMVESCDIDGWDGSDWLASEVNNLSLTVQPKSYGLFYVQYRVAMSNVQSWTEGWTYLPGYTSYYDCLGFDTYRVAVNVVPPNSAPNTPYSPDPYDGEDGVSIGQDLDWSCTDSDGDTLYYTVYFEKNDTSPDVIVKNDQTGSSCALSQLDYNSHYYWRVVADDHRGGVTSSPVWDFYTAAPAPYISGISPSAGPRHKIVTISGSNFGAARGSSYVRFGSAQVSTDEYWEWTDTQIRVDVPTGALSGTVGVVVHTTGGDSNTRNFYVQGYPYPRMTIDGIPSSIEEGQSFTFQVTLANDGGIADRGGVAVSFPDLDQQHSGMGAQGPYDTSQARVETSSASYPAGEVRYFDYGDSLSDPPGSSAQHLLVDCDTGPFSGSKYITIRVTPRQINDGVLNIRIRGFLSVGGPWGYEGAMFRDPASSGTGRELDQQNHWSYVKNIVIGSDPRIVEKSISTTTTRDGRTISIGYRINNPTNDPVPVGLGCSIIDPAGKEAYDISNDDIINAQPGTYWYYRDFLVNLPPEALTGLYDVVWGIWRILNDEFEELYEIVQEQNMLTVQDSILVTIPILMYHKFGDTAHSQYWVTTDEFRAQMEALKAYGYSTITLQELMDERAGILADKKVIITVDDGYENLLTEAYPIISDPAINYKVTAFIPTGRLGGTNDWDTGDNVPLIDHLTWSQVQTLHNSGRVDFQSHSVTHPDLTALSDSQVEAELKNSKDAIENNLNKPVKFLSWPFGAYDLRVQNKAYEAGYFAALNAWGGVEQDSSDKWALKRIYVDWNTSVDFDENHTENFFLTKLEDPDVRVPLINIDSIEYLNPSNDEPLAYNQVVRGNPVKIRVTATNEGESANVVASLNIDSDSNPGNGIVYDSHLVSPSEDISETFSTGQKVFEWIWDVPIEAEEGLYYVAVGFHDQYYVLGYEYSGWRSAFNVVGSNNQVQEYWTSVQFGGVNYDLTITKYILDSSVQGIPLKYWDGSVLGIQIDPDNGLSNFEKYQIAIAAENKLIVDREVAVYVIDPAGYCVLGKYPEQRTDDHSNIYHAVKSDIAEAFNMDWLYYDGWIGFGGLDDPGERRRVYKDLLVDLCINMESLAENPDLEEIRAINQYVNILNEAGNNVLAKRILGFAKREIRDLARDELAQILEEMKTGTLNSALHHRKMDLYNNLNSISNIIKGSFVGLEWSSYVFNAALTRMAIQADAQYKLELLDNILRNSTDVDPQLLLALYDAKNHLNDMRNSFLSCFADAVTNHHVSSLDDYTTHVSEWFIYNHGGTIAEKAARYIVEHLVSKNPKTLAFAGGAVLGLFSSWKSIDSSVKLVRYISLQLSVLRHIHLWILNQNFSDLSYENLFTLARTVDLNQEIALASLKKHLVTIEGHFYSLFLLDPIGFLNFIRDFFGEYDAVKDAWYYDEAKYMSMRENLSSIYYFTSPEINQIFETILLEEVVPVPVNPIPQVSVVSYPSSIRVGENIDVVVDVSNSGGQAALSYFDISCSNNIEMLNIAPNEYLTKYDIGDLIWHRDDYQFSALNKLYSYVYPSFAGSTTKRYHIRFQSHEEGSHWLKIRLSLGFDDQGEFIRYPVSGSQDQQGYFILPININVTENRRPVINSYSPVSDTVEISSGSSENFSVNASDPDGDAVETAWYFNNHYLVTEGSCQIAAVDYPAGTYELLAIVSDYQSVTTQRWQVTIGGGVVPCLYVDPNSWEAPSGGGTSPSVEVINSGGGGGFDYDVTETLDWLRVTSGAGTTPGSFQIIADPNDTESARVGTITVSAEGIDGSPQIVTVTQEPDIVDAPEIQINQNMIEIPSGGDYSFGEVAIGDYLDIPFSIENLGTDNLLLSGSPVIVITGVGSAEYDVEKQPNSTIAPGGASTFIIRFSPSSASNFNASISISNNDSNENPYDIDLSGIGVRILPASERNALIALYNSTNGDSWIDNSGWKDGLLEADGFGPYGSEDSWYGIEIINNIVTGIRLGNNNLVGTIPPDVANFVNLEVLNLSENQITGGIPYALTLLQSLYHLDLSSNQLSGSIPPTIGNLMLFTLDLSSNQLTGNIPTEIGDILDLRVLDLSANNLSGNIPPELGNLSHALFYHLNLSNNHLEGSIPAPLGSLDELTYLDLSSNMLQGEVPSLFTNLIYLNTLDLGYNSLYCTNTTVNDFLDSKDPDWEETQTVAPANVKATALSESEITVSWDAIAFTGYTGGYRVYYSTTSGGPWTFDEMTASKSDTEHTVDGLAGGTTYYVMVRTQTNPHASNPNTVVSEGSGEDSATTHGVCVGPAITQHPLSQTINYSTSATLSVTATGTPPFTYQWYRGASGDTTNPVGGDSSSYVTPNLVVTTSYWVRVTNACGHDDSNTATLTVRQEIIMGSIILNPSDFNQYQDDNDYAYDEDYLFCRAGSSGRLFYAPVHLPHDARITSVVAFYMDNDASGNVEVIMYKRNIYTRDYTEMCYHMSSGASSGIQRYKMAPIMSNRIDNGGYVYNVRVHFTDPGENTRLYRIKILYKTN